MSRIEEMDADLEPGFNPRSGRCFVRLAQDDPSRCRDILIELIVKASDTFSVEND